MSFGADNSALYLQLMPDRVVVKMSLGSMLVLEMTMVSGVSFEDSCDDIIWLSYVLLHASIKNGTMFSLIFMLGMMEESNSTVKHRLS